jgi:hypothetical protein
LYNKIFQNIVRSVVMDYSNGISTTIYRSGDDRRLTILHGIIFEHDNSVMFTFDDIAYEGDCLYIGVWK